MVSDPTAQACGPTSNQAQAEGLDAHEIALLPLLRWVRPELDSARARVHRAIDALARRYPAQLDAAALAPSIEAAFVRPLLNWSRRALIVTLGTARDAQSLDGDTPEARYQAFIASLDTPAVRQQIDARYACLRPGAKHRIRQVARGIVRLLRRVARDHAALAAHFSLTLGTLRSFAPRQGDPHCGGQSVTLLTFDSARLYYKPHGLGNDVALARLFDWLAEHDVTPSQRATAVLDCGDYGYCAEIQHHDASGEAGVQAYYRRFGGWVAIAYLLGACDLHFENLIASGDYPILIDTETLLQPSYVTRRTRHTTRHPWAETVLSSNLLPCGTLLGRQSDISALDTAEGEQLRLRPQDVGTDNLHLRPQRLPMAQSNNLPTLNGQVAPPEDFVEAICDGFDSTYQGLLRLQALLRRDDGPLGSFKTLCVRVIVRATQIYAHLLNALAHPDYQGSRQQQEALIRRIWSGEAVWAPYRRTWPSERAALLRGDVPYFTIGIDSHDVVDDQGKVIAGQYGSTAWDEAQRRVRQLSHRDHARQRRLLQQAVVCLRPRAESARWASLPPTSPAETMPPFSATACRAEAVVMGDRILHTGFFERVPVRTFQLESHEAAFSRPFPLNYELYDGIAGLAVFFGELYGQTRLVRFRRAAEAAVATVRLMYTQYGTPPDSIGAFSGVSGWLYTLALLGHRLGRADWIAEAVACLPWVAERLAADTHYDVIGGAAGALLVLCEIARLAPHSAALTLAGQCASHLAAAAQHDGDGACWPSTINEGKPVTGFSHGASGIAAALARYTELSGSTTHTALIQAALRFERRCLDPASGQWRDLRNAVNERHGDAAHQFAWCHGAPGIGLGRLALPATLRDAAWQVDVDACLTTTRAHGFHGSHCVCHGQLGNVELLLQDAMRPSQQQAQADWRPFAARILAEGRQQWRTGWLADHELLGFMPGLAGMGYQLLRLAAPTSVPAVLLLEILPPAHHTTGIHPNVSEHERDAPEVCDLAH